MNNRLDGTRMKGPAVSVVVCCYNAEETVASTLESLQKQSFTDFEIVAIDDGSSDNTVGQLGDFAAVEPRLRVLQNPSNRGTAFTHQRGLEEARGQFVMFVDADDIAEPALLSRLFDTITADPDLIGVGCFATYFTDEGADLGLQRVGPRSCAEFNRMYRDAKLMFMVPVTMFRKRDALAVGGYRQGIMPNDHSIRYEDFSEDLDLWCRMSDLGAEGRYFVTIPEPLFRYRKPTGSLSTNNLKLMQLKMRWIKDCLRRRRAGQPERDLAKFIASRGLFERFADWRSDHAAAFYKRAAFAYAQRSFLRLVWYLTLTGMISPKLIRQKIATQTVARSKV